MALAGTLGFVAAMAADEAQPHVEGANDNATAVSVLLGIAEDALMGTGRMKSLDPTEGS